MEALESEAERSLQEALDLEREQNAELLKNHNTAVDALRAARRVNADVRFPYASAYSGRRTAASFSCWVGQ